MRGICVQVSASPPIRSSRLDAGGWGTWRGVFLVGDCVQELAAEQAQHGDLLITGVAESYHSITAKVLYFLDYAAAQDVRYVMKTDDDTFVFIDRILQEIKVSTLLRCGAERHSDVPCVVTFLSENGPTLPLLGLKGY